MDGENRANRKPLVSIVMPTFNSEKYLLEAVKSVKDQTETRWELIIVDDASTDNTLQLAKRESVIDDRIIVLKQDVNSGPSVTRNLGITKARGDFVAFLDADDLLSPTAISERVSALKADPKAVGSYCDPILFADDGGHLGRLFTPDTVGFPDLVENKFPTSLVLLRRIALTEEGGFDESLRFGEDWDLWLRLARTGARFVKASGCKVFYRQYPESMTHPKASLDCEQRLSVMERAWKEDPSCKRPLKEFKSGMGAAVQIATKSKRAFATALAELVSGVTESANELMQYVSPDVLVVLNSQGLAAQCKFMIRKSLCWTERDWYNNISAHRLQIEEFLRAHHIAEDEVFVARFYSYLFEPRSTHIANVFAAGWKIFINYAVGTFGKRRSWGRLYAGKSTGQGLPLVTIVTPSYRHAEFIEGTLDSVAGQDYPLIEHIVVDGGSDDGTLEILEARKDQLSYVSEPDTGQSNAINKGFAKANGEIVAWLNSDDVYYSSDVVSAVVRFFARYPDVDVVYGRGDFVDADGKSLREAFVQRDSSKLAYSFASTVGILQPAVFFRKSVIDKVGPLDESNGNCMDYEFWLRIVHSGLRMRFINKKIAKARYHENMKSHKLRGEQLLATMEVARKYYGFVHPRWMNIYAKYVITGNPQIISEDDYDDLNAKKVAEIEGELFRKYNSQPEALKALLDSSLCDGKLAKSYIERYLSKSDGFDTHRAISPSSSERNR